MIKKLITILFLCGISLAQQVTIQSGTIQLKQKVTIGPPTTPAPTLVSLQVTPGTISIGAGSSTTFTAQGTFDDGSINDVTSSCTWTSSNGTVAIIGTSGNPQPVSGSAAGTSNITCTIGAISNFGVITVIRFNIVPATLPNGFVGVFYNVTISSTGGLNPITYSITSGALPTGISCANVTNTFVCSGTPSVAAVYNINVHAVDSSGSPQTDDQLYTINIGGGGTSVAQLPQNWVNPHECDAARDTGTPNVTFNIPGDYPATSAGIIQAFTDAETFREGHAEGSGNVLILLDPTLNVNGTSVGFTIHGAGYTGTQNCVWVKGNTAGAIERGVRLGSIKITAISNNGLVVSATTSKPHGLNTGDLATIQNVTSNSNVGATNFNVYEDGGGVAVTKVDNTHFTYNKIGTIESGIVHGPYTTVTGQNTLAQQTSLFPKLVAGVSNSPVLNCEGKGKYWYFENIEFTTLTTVQQDTGIVVFGSTAGHTFDTQCFHIGLEQVYYHGCAGTVPTTIPIFPEPVGCGSVETKSKNLNRMLCGNCSVINSFGDQAVYNGVDSHVTGSFAGQGPMLFVNNHFRGGSTTFHFGGAPQPIPFLVATDVQVGANQIDRDPNWRTLSGSGVVGGRGWNLKNNNEYKVMSRLVFYGNVVKNNWADGQAGDQSLDTVRGDNYWDTTNNLTREGNIFAHAYGPFEVLGRDQSVAGNGAGFSMTLNNVTNRNNLWYGLGDGAYALTNGAVRVHPLGTGNQSYSCASSRAGGVVTLSACVCQPTVANCGPGGNFTGISAGDWLNVSCTDTTMNTNPTANGPKVFATSSSPFTNGPISYPSPGSPGSSTCTLNNDLGWPLNIQNDHNTIVIVGPGNSINAPLLLLPTTGNFPRGVKETNNIFVRNSGNRFVFYSGNNLDGSKSTQGAAGLDQASFEFHHLLQSGGTVQAIGNQSEWNPVGVEITPVHLWLNIPPACGGGGPNPASPTCIGMRGDMSSFNNPTNGDPYQYQLKSNSFFAAGNGGQGSDGKDLGADFTVIQNKPFEDPYICATDCTQGGTVHGPWQVNF